MNKLLTAKVIIFGVGGVGSWCAEGLVRSGLYNLTIVDKDRVCVSNINRQLMATTNTIGEIKVDALKKHLLEINPQANITTLFQQYDAETANTFDLDSYDYVVDCIDSVSDKMLLINNATKSCAKLFSSMGAALKKDSTKIKVAEFREVKGCPLARALRHKMKRDNKFPFKKFRCVYSDELLKNHEEEMTGEKANGSIMHITSIFGLTLSGLIINDITR